MFLLFACLAAAGCARNTDTPLPAARAPDIVDFSGHWEKDYRLSDDFETRFSLFMYDLQRSVYPNNSAFPGDPVTTRPGGAGSMQSVLGLARLTEEITRTPTLDIEQDENTVTIKREDNFSLHCEFYEQQFVRTRNTFGRELCGWNGERLVFRISLDQGLNILHRVTMAPDGRQMNITTSVSSREVSMPITISTYYRRYTPQSEQYDCTYTLTRNNVCSQGGRQ